MMLSFKLPEGTDEVAVVRLIEDSIYHVVNLRQDSDDKGELEYVGTDSKVFHDRDGLRLCFGIHDGGPSGVWVRDTSVVDYIPDAGVVRVVSPARNDGLEYDALRFALRDHLIYKIVEDLGGVMEDA